jgi:hypothetical protein
MRRINQKTTMKRPRKGTINVAEARKHGLGAVKGWLSDDDPFLAEIDRIVSERFEHRPLTSHKSGRSAKQ